MATGDGETWPLQWAEAVDGSWRLPICNGTQFPDTDNCSRPEAIPSSPIFVHVYGLIWPAVILFTIVTNILVSAVLLRPSMRSATNWVRDSSASRGRTGVTGVAMRGITQRHAIVSGPRRASRHKSRDQSHDLLRRDDNHGYRLLTVELTAS